MIDSSHGCLMQGVDAKRVTPDSLEHSIFRERNEGFCHGRPRQTIRTYAPLRGIILPESAAVAHLACRVLEEIVDVLVGLGLQSSFRLDPLGNLDCRFQPYIRV